MSVVSVENADHFIWGNKCDGWHLVKSAQLSVIQERVPSGCSEERHCHIKAEQFFFVLSGVAAIEVNGVVHEVNPHEGLYVPAGAPHQLRNEKADELVFIVISTPPSHGDRVKA